MNNLKDVRIIFFTHYAELYGANRSLVDLVSGGKKLYSGFNSLIIVPKEGKLTELLRQLNLAYKIIPFHSCVTNNCTPKLSAQVKGLLKLFINKVLQFRYYNSLSQFEPDIIHSNSSVFTFGAQLANKMKKPHIWHIREFIYEDYNYKYDLGESYFRNYLNQACYAIAITNAIHAKRCQHIRCNSVIIYNGIVFENNIKQKRQNDLFTFGMVGVINTGKNQLEGIKAFGSLVKEQPDILLKVYGDFVNKNYEIEIKDYIEKHGLVNNIEFAGYKNSINEIFENIDCLIHCAHNEAMGRVTVEAMSYGIPVIGYNGAGTKEIITNGKNGFLYETEDQLYEASKLLILNSNRYNDVSSECIKLVKEKFTIERYTDEIFSIYNSAIKA